MKLTCSCVEDWDEGRHSAQGCHSSQLISNSLYPFYKHIPIALEQDPWILREVMTWGWWSGLIITPGIVRDGPWGHILKEKFPWHGVTSLISEPENKNIWTLKQESFESLLSLHLHTFEQHDVLSCLNTLNTYFPQKQSEQWDTHSLLTQCHVSPHFDPWILWWITEKHCWAQSFSYKTSSVCAHDKSQMRTL